MTFHIFLSDRIGLSYFARPGWDSSWKGFARDSAISKKWHITGASDDQRLTWDTQWRVRTRKQQMEEKQDWAWTFWLDHVTWASYLNPLHHDCTPFHLFSYIKEHRLPKSGRSWECQPHAESYNRETWRLIWVSPKLTQFSPPELWGHKVTKPKAWNKSIIVHFGFPKLVWNQNTQPPLVWSF